MKKELAARGIAACGLVCAFCSVEDCPGCKACGGSANCVIAGCARDKGLESCALCESFPCEKERHGGLRSLAFLEYIRDYGPDALLARLGENSRKGIPYHYPGKTVGPYDQFKEKEDIWSLLDWGKGSDPYVECPCLETERFTLRLVERTDREALLECYADPKARRLFNHDNCTNDFCFSTVEEMEEMIDFWLRDYRSRNYVRFAIVDKETGRASGTVEIFCNREEWGVLRVDLASRLEQEEYLGQVFGLLPSCLFRLFPAKVIVTKAPPHGRERLAVLARMGFAACDIPGRRDYYGLEKTTD